MADVAFVAVALGFFGLCVGYVRALDRMVRHAEADGTDEVADVVDRAGVVGEAR